MNNGFSSGYFKLERGVRQGDPLSAYLFILVIEVLAIQIRNQQDIKGIIIENKEFKLSISADNLTVFLENEISFNNLLKVLKSFETCAGLKINNLKT